MLKTKSETFFFIGYILMLTSQMLSNVIFIENYTSYLTYLGFIFLVICVIKKIHKYTIKNILLFSLFTIIFLIVSLVANDKKMLKLMAIIIAFQGIDFETFIKKDFKYRLLLTVTVVGMSLLGLTYNNDVPRIGETTIRYSLGFQHPNNFAVYTMVLAMEFLYLCRNQKKNGQYIFILLIFGLNYFLTDSRAAMIIEFLMILYLLISKENVDKIFNRPIIKYVIIFSFLISLVASIFLGLNYSHENQNFISKINRITSERIMLANRYMKKYPIISIFGNNIPEANRYIDKSNNPNYIPLDNGYIHLLLEFGILVTIIFIYCYFISITRLYKSKNYSLILILFLLNLYLVMEATIYAVLYNPFLLIFSTVFYDDIKGIDSKILDKKNNNSLKIDKSKLNNLVVEIANKALNEIDQYGYILPGNNGPYDCEDTPVRNCAHWIGIYKYLYTINRNEKYYDAVETLANYIVDQKSKSGAIECMLNDKMDHLNGSIGQGWAIEGLIAAYQLTKNEIYYDKAVEIFMSQKYDFNQHMWTRIEINGENIGYDKVFNHQLWFAASGFLINQAKENSKIFETINDFMENADSLYHIYPSGLLKHYITKFPVSTFKKCKNIAKKLLSPILQFHVKYDVVSFEKMYHIFDMYGFAIIYNCNNHYKIFESEKFKKATCYTINLINNELLTGKQTEHSKSFMHYYNNYAYAYNSPAFEFPYVDYTFNHAENKEIYQMLLEKQITLTYNNTTYKFDQHTNDGNTLTARLYELTRYLEMDMVENEK